MSEQKSLPGIKRPKLTEKKKEGLLFKELEARATSEEKQELFRSGWDRDDLVRYVRRLAKKYGLDDLLPRKFIRRRLPKKTYVTQELTKYEDVALNSVRLLERQSLERFDKEIKKDVIVYTRREGDLLQEYIFDKTVVDIENKRHTPSTRAIRSDVRATLSIAYQKDKNPVAFTAKEKMKALGFAEDQIKKPTSRHYEMVKIPFIQAAAFRFYEWRIVKDKDGKEKRKLLQIINAPYERIKIPEKKGEKYEADISARFLRHLGIGNGELEAGKYKSISRHNPYRGRIIEERFFEWLEMNVKGRRLRISVERILKDILKIHSPDYQRKKLYQSYLGRCFAVTKEQGYDFEIDTKGEGPGGQAAAHLLQRYTFEEIEKRRPDLDLGDCRKWIITFEFQTKELHPIGPEDEKFIEGMIDYFYDELRLAIENPREKTRDYFRFYIQRFGRDPVAEIFEDVKESPKETQIGLFFKRLEAVEKERL